MEFPVKTGAPARQRTECAILPVFDDRQAVRARRKDFDRAARGAITKLVRAGDAPSRVGRRHARAPHARHGRRSLAARRLRQARRFHAPNASRRRSPPRSTRCAAAAPRKRRAISGYDTTAWRRADTARHSVETARAERVPLRRAQEPHRPAVAARAPRLGLPERHQRERRARRHQDRQRDRRGQRSRARPRQSSSQRLHAVAPRGSRARHREALRAHGSEGARRSRHAQARHGRPAVASRKAPTSRRA